MGSVASEQLCSCTVCAKTLLDVGQRPAEALPRFTAKAKRPEDLDFTLLTGGWEKCLIPSAEDRGILLLQLCSLLDFMASHTSAKSDWREADRADDALLGWYDDRTGDELLLHAVTLYQVVDWIVKPSTEADRCSYVELIAQDARSQKPTWFVSHWWGEPMTDFVRCVESHKTLRKLPDATGYWVCAFSNNHWCLSQEVIKDPTDMPFGKAIGACTGTLSIIDQSGVAFTRIWCCYELSIALGESQSKPLDLAIATSTCSVAVLSSGFTAQDKQEGDLPQWQHLGGAVAAKAARERQFPLDILAKGFKVRLEEGQASLDIDRVRILNRVAGGDELEAEPPTHSGRYEDVNRALSWHFAALCYEQAFDAGKVDALGLQDIEPQGEAAPDRCEEMAHTFQRGGKLGLALEFHEKALALRLKAVGRWHPDVGTIHNNMAWAYRAQGEHKKALESYEKALAIFFQTLGPEQPDVGTTLNNMAVAYHALGKHEKALESLQKALAIFLKALGREHPDVGNTYCGMATVYRALGKYDQGVKFFEEAAATYASCYGADHAETTGAKEQAAALRAALE